MVLKRDNLMAEGSTIFGTAAAAINPPGDVTASLCTGSHSGGRSIEKPCPGQKWKCKGSSPARRTFGRLYKQISDTTAWIGTAKVTSPELVIARPSAKTRNS